MRTTRAIPLLTVATALLGCHSDPPLDPKTSADQAATRAAAVVRATGNGLAFIGDDGGVVGKTLSGFDGATSGIMRKMVSTPLPTPLIRQMRSSPVVKSMGGVQALPSFLTQEEQFDETARDVETLLRDRLLVESNIESKTDSQITYLLKPEPTCRPLPSSGSTEPDAGCVRDLPKLQVRLVSEADGDGIRLTVQVGPARDELSAFVIHSDRLAWEVGFARALKAVEFINMTLEPAADQKPYPFTKLEGRIEVALQKLAPSKVEGSLGILEAITVEADDPQISFNTAKAAPLFAVTGDGVARTATLRWGLGQTEVRAPWDPQGLNLKNRDLLVSIGGSYGAATLVADGNQIALQGYGVGATFVSVRGTHVFDLDFNPHDGRRMDVLVSAPGDVPRLAVTPRFDLSLAFNLAAVAGELKDPPPAPLLHETYTVVLDGAVPAVVEAAKQAPGFGGGIKVVAGTLTVATNGTPATTVVVPAGKCLTGKEMVPMGAHEILGRLDVVSCP
jgi:hypothetical protein